jgi:hypothetical protein
MNIEQIKHLFFWMTIINLGLYVYSVLIFTLGRKWIYNLKVVKLNFQIEPETFGLIIYCFLGLYKLLILFFCVIPYLALLITT